MVNKKNILLAAAAVGGGYYLKSNNIIDMSNLFSNDNNDENNSRDIPFRRASYIIKSSFDLKKSTEFNIFLLLDLNFLYSQNNS